ncbi:ATP-binding protein [Stenotrophomonas geniculata]|uniref:ATP-binding protein n=1 Tax=Stenotrophomonas geniculata TaxID=86188 RepID=UPI003AB0AE98
MNLDGKRGAGMQEDLYFDVSSGLKSVIGRDLITNDEVAIFELVKNSFDANASNVQIYFGAAEIIIVDDGEGMSLNEIKSKWLQVAYSSKKGSDQSNFRANLTARKHYAGSKGIGRFSSDRLGESLVLQTRASQAADDLVNKLRIEWGLFDGDLTAKFESIPIAYSTSSAFELPEGLTVPEHGTAISVENTRLVWDRDRIKQLKRSLAKLINPFGSASDGFRIRIVAPAELGADRDLIAKSESRQNIESDLINGDVGNFIFASLREKTTHINVCIEGEGSKIVTTLTDRGEVVYKIREDNVYGLLAQAGFTCDLYYLNQSAKATFARRMGMPSVQFGSVFLFRNGFRVFPVGEEHDDTFGIDRRKQQGYARYLGTRDVIGRIDVFGTEALFREASSRNQGLVDTPAVLELFDCFWEKCLKRLERYVVPVTWADKAEKNTDDLSRLLTDAGKARVTSAFAKIVEDEDVEVISYSKDLISALNERSAQFESSLDSLKTIALKTADKGLLDSLELAEERFAELRKAEADALKTAEQERLAKERAQREASQARAAAESANLELEEERSRNLFLKSMTSLDLDVIVNMHHQITIYAADLRTQVENCLAVARIKGGLALADAEARLEQVSFLSQKILSVSKIATKANFRLESDQIEDDIASFVESYINDANKPFLNNISVVVSKGDVSLSKRFRPMEMAVVIDNLINNSKKAGASELLVTMGMEAKDVLLISFADNGSGLDKGISDPSRIFEMGFTRTSGSGLGLYHVRQALGELNGSIAMDHAHEHGAKFDIRITK